MDDNDIVVLKLRELRSVIFACPNNSSHLLVSRPVYKDFGLTGDAHPLTVLTEVRPYCETCKVDAIPRGANDRQT